MANYRNGHIYHKRHLPIEGHLCVEHPLYGVWSSMISRCENTDDPAYASYGGRGISVCARWRNSFEVFVIDMGAKPTKHHSIDRRDNDKGYSPANCRWATRSEQMHNRRQFKNNTTGAPGVVAVKNGRFKASWNTDGVKYILGQHDSVAAASAYRDQFIALFYTDPIAAMQMTERRARYDSTTGVRGISRHVDGGFVVRKTVNRVRKYLGYRKTYEEALALWTEHK